jgi:cytochrome c biogenesis protein CcmG/thiol:disulfide interchange protein DsbE
MITIGAVCAAAALYFGLASSGAQGGRTAPALPTRSLSGGHATIATLTAGGARAIVVFFASWCGPCRAEAPAVAAFARGPGRGRIALVDYAGDPGGASFVRAQHWTMPVLADPEGRTGEAYGFHGLPAVFVISKSGKIVRRVEGPQTVASLEAALRAG